MLHTATNGSDHFGSSSVCKPSLSNCYGNKAMNTNEKVILSSFFLSISFESTRAQSNVTVGEACLICVIVRPITLAFVKSQIHGAVVQWAVQRRGDKICGAFRRPATITSPLSLSRHLTWQTIKRISHFQRKNVLSSKSGNDTTPLIRLLYVQVPSWAQSLRPPLTGQ